MRRLDRCPCPEWSARSAWWELWPDGRSVVAMSGPRRRPGGGQAQGVVGATGVASDGPSELDGTDRARLGRHGAEHRSAPVELGAHPGQLGAHLEEVHELVAD